MGNSSLLAELIKRVKAGERSVAPVRAVVSVREGCMVICFDRHDLSREAPNDLAKKIYRCSLGLLLIRFKIPPPACNINGRVLVILPVSKLLGHILHINLDQLS